MTRHYCGASRQQQQQQSLPSNRLCLNDLTVQTNEAPRRERESERSKAKQRWRSKGGSRAPRSFSTRRRIFPFKDARSRAIFPAPMRTRAPITSANFNSSPPPERPQVHPSTFRNYDGARARTPGNNVLYANISRRPPPPSATSTHWRSRGQYSHRACVCGRELDPHHPEME